MHRLDTIGTGLIQAPAAGGRPLLAVKGDLHLAHNADAQFVHLIKGPGRQHTDCRAGGKPTLDGQCLFCDMNPQPAHTVVLVHIGSHPGHIGVVASLIGFLPQEGCVHIADKTVLGQITLDDELIRCADRCVNSLLDPRDDGLSRHNPGINNSMQPRPVAVFAEQAKSPRHKKIDGFPLFFSHLFVEYLFQIPVLLSLLIVSHFVSLMIPDNSQAASVL